MPDPTRKIASLRPQTGPASLHGEIVFLACASPAAPNRIRALLEARGCDVFAVSSALEAAWIASGELLPAILVVDKENPVRDLRGFLSTISSCPRLGAVPVLLANSERRRP